MNENGAQSLTEKTSKLLTPIYGLNKTAIENLAKMTEIQLSTAKYLTDIGLAQLKAASEIRDFEGVRSFTSRTVQLASDVNKKLIDDGKYLAEIGNGMRTGISNLFNRTEEEQVPAKDKRVAK